MTHTDVYWCRCVAGLRACGVLCLLIHMDMRIVVPLLMVLLYWGIPSEEYRWGPHTRFMWGTLVRH